jgi:hypothetical protein
LTTTTTAPLTATFTLTTIPIRAAIAITASTLAAITTKP